VDLRNKIALEAPESLRQAPLFSRPGENFTVSPANALARKPFTENNSSDGIRIRKIF
jgi:hypothetical protein